MTLFYKLYQPLWFQSYKFYRKTHVLSKHIYNTKRIISLNNFITENADIYEQITENLSTTQWKDMREKVLQKNQQITPAIVDSTIMDMCFKKCYVDSAIEYFKFLKENNYPLNTAIIGKYLKFFVYKQDSLTDADKTEIIETYNALRQKHPYLDYFTAEQCIMSLCLTDEWEKTHEIIEMVKITSNPGTTMYSALASAAFKNGKPDIAWKALEDIILCKLIPQNNVYASHLQYCQLEDMKTFNNRMEDIFNFWAKYNIIPYNKVINAYADAASKYGWSTQLVTISRETGNCKHCGYSLSKITFTEKEFQELAKSIMDRVIIGSDVYRKTNPQELLKFQRFIENTKPYDIVMDGLNLTYMQNKTGPTLYWLINVVDYFNKQKKKILVLTRKHQKKLFSFKQIERRAHVFLLDDLSADDPYILYATMASGMNAMFISLDLMRQHKHSLQNEHLRQTFKKWQYSHQYFLKKSKTGIRIQDPFACMPFVQKINNCWHVPYVSDDLVIAESYEFPKKWCCFKYNEKR
ncbi:mitochondrial ribonuclease P catalytic subunit [Solenopsis invicta]|uniref:mitochondrial ribonuclease P catalytic subunit n=1 Tax=Solenopsis invicta TaxID=13686 RepID=UPI000595DB45|nr:mitochondrial ribonuclease P catalytic subunit [Solenopsis invicta]XP_011155904.1 mitochondrial ribonuclease P catalytic subunit [Solenopsis invicta]XP_025991279.1 mitochondrial ribonuclease P catalytic subunit [Solenopsis invicta]